jgi:hypothetical protein
MSGPLSVPAAFLALVVETTWLKVLFGTLSICGGVFAAFWVWREERRAVFAVESRLNRLEERLRPKVEASFDPNCPGCSRRGFDNWSTLHHLVKIGLRNVGAGTVTGVTAWLTRWDQKINRLPTPYNLQIDGEASVDIQHSEGHSHHIDLIAIPLDKHANIRFLDTALYVIDRDKGLSGTIEIRSRDDFSVSYRLAIRVIEGVIDRPDVIFEPQDTLPLPMEDA